MLTSVADSPLCLECKLLQYKVVRDPPLRWSMASTLHFSRRFTDVSVLSGQGDDQVGTGVAGRM